VVFNNSKTTSNCIDILVDTLKPWVHYIPVRLDLSDLPEQFQFIQQNEDKVKSIIQNANDWCASQLHISNLQKLFLTTITEYLEQLDMYNRLWQEEIWTQQKHEYLSGHFFLYRSNLYILPKPVVGAIKQGLRRDDPSFSNITIGNLER
jgi:RNAse (barnase) inhibitor barstar